MLFEWRHFLPSFNPQVPCFPTTIYPLPAAHSYYSPWPTGLPLMLLWTLLAVFGARVHCWLTFSSRCPKNFFPQLLLPRPQVPCLYHRQRVFLPRRRILHLLLLSLMKFLSVHFFSSLSGWKPCLPAYLLVPPIWYQLPTVFPRLLFYFFFTQNLIDSKVINV